MAKKRVHEIAKERNMTSKELLRRLLVAFQAFDRCEERVRTGRYEEAVALA